MCQTKPAVLGTIVPTSSPVLLELPGGGLTIPNRAGTYGEPGAARLDELLVGNSSGGYGSTYKYGELVTSVSQLTPGDVIGYDWDGSGGGSMSGIDHTVVYLGNNELTAHATSHDGVTWNSGSSSSTITFFIHITLPDSIVPTAPSNVSPAANTSVSNLTPILTASAFSDGAIGSTQVAAQWLIYNGSSMAYDSGTDTTHLTSLTVPTGKLSLGNTYTWKVRYEDNYGDWSSYSTPTSLITTLPGDYNHDGVVDAADYLVWRKDPANNGGTLGGYSAWRTNFGMTAGSGAALLTAETQSAAVPEPSSAVCLAGLLLLFTWRNGRGESGR